MKVYCSKCEKEVDIYFDIQDVSTFCRPHQIIFGLMRSCSNTKNICSDCPYTKWTGAGVTR